MINKQLRPSEQKSRSYVDGIKQHNGILRNSVSEYLAEKLPYVAGDEGLAIVTTGSDGRFEKSLLSPVELVLLNSGSSNFDRAKGDLEQIVCDNKGIFEDKLEFKDLDSQKSSIFYATNQVFPSRCIDAIGLIGNDELANRYKLNLIDELNGTDGKKLLSKVKNRKRDPRKILETGVSKYGLNFDLNSGELIYDGDCIKSTKYGHLRSVQYKITSDICSAIRGDKFNSENLLLGICGNMSDRLYNFYYQDMLNMSASEVSEVTDAYLTSVYWYHLSEEKFIINEESSINVDVGEFKEVTSILRQFARRDNVFD